MAILLVDDSQDIRTLLKRILEASGKYEVVAVDSARQALKLLGIGEGLEPTGAFDLILMDILMPDIDGIEACRIIKSDPRLADVPLLMVTAKPDTEDLQEAFGVGASDYIRKPVHPGVLLARVRHALRLKSEIDQRKRREQELVEAQARLEEVNERLRRLAASDGLTGIANRRHFDEYLDHEWRRMQREQRPLALVLIDIDCFKLYNDHYGHQAGDDCLRQVAGLIEEGANRPGDMAARYGGEEFVMVLPGTDLAGAEVVVERIRARLAETAIPHEASKVGSVVTISGGTAAVVPQLGRSQEELIEAADRALYQAKRGGRNRVCRSEWGNDAPPAPVPQ